MGKKRQKTGIRGRKIKRRLNPGLQLAVNAAGGTLTSLAKLLGIAPQSVAQWDSVPTHHMINVERLTGVGRERLRPDLFRKAS